MLSINCPKCHKKTEINISKSVDSEGEVFACEHCGYKFRFTER